MLIGAHVGIALPVVNSVPLGSDVPVSANEYEDAGTKAVSMIVMRSNEITAMAAIGFLCFMIFLLIDVRPCEIFATTPVSCGMPDFGISNSKNGRKTKSAQRRLFPANGCLCGYCGVIVPTGDAKAAQSMFKRSRERGAQGYLWPWAVQDMRFFLQ
jgi:hypothetical protein